MESTKPLEFEVPARNYLNSTGCYIQNVEGKGRGVFASREILAHTDIEISPVLLFTSSEYQQHGKYTMLDHYTFKWRDGRMALSLGLGSLFNHSQTPNISYRLEPNIDSIRYTTTRRIKPDEELCIFYGHALWFEPVDKQDSTVREDAVEDEWGGLFHLQQEEEKNGPFLQGSPEELVPEHELPFTRLRLVDDEAEDELSAVQTEPAWVVDIPNPKYTAGMLKWLKQTDYDALAHLKRIRKTGSTTTLLLCTVSLAPMVPQLPVDIGLDPPYVLQVPRSAALTQAALRHKTMFWPTVYAPRKKHELEPWPRAKVRWAWEAMRTVMDETNAVKAKGELPVVAHVPVPYDEAVRQATQVTKAITAHDKRVSASHPLRHAALNLVRLIADQHAKIPTAPCAGKEVANNDDSKTCNGAHYLLTDLTVFLSHEPCIMCSMALLHSRVQEVIYFVPMEKTGGCGSVACLPKLPGVNHRFSIGRWKLTASDWKADDLHVGEEVDA
ncbi:hypothetical protein BC835DRAFT_1406574 [Cytidiella melzeri]|nr:hypothetical protein BC835DRAFT_1406574 [Cytidiella melzeri]